MFENRVLRRVFGPKWEEDGSRRKLHNNELHSLYSSPIIVRVIQSRRMKWAGHVARMGEGRGVYRVSVVGPKGRDHWEDIGVGGRITLRWTCGRLGPLAALCEDGNESLGSVKKQNIFFFDKLSDNELFK
jgi:hypothetical protein